MRITIDQSSPTSSLYIWDRRTLFVGVMSRPLRFSQSAAILTVSLDQPIRIHVKSVGRELLCHSWLSRTGQTVQADSGNAVIATCYLDVFGCDYAALASGMTQHHGALSLHLGEESRFQQTFRTILEDQPAPDTAYAMLDRLLCAGDGSSPAVDPRVVQVVSLIKATVSQNMSVEELAQQVDLSVARLVQIFKQQVGVPIRRYRQWHRLYVTAVGVARGNSLTDAAIAAGFTDSSHFSRTFRSMLGMKPSQILSQLDRVRVFAPPTPELDASLRQPRGRPASP